MKRSADHPRARVVRGACVTEWAWLLGISQQALSWRLKHWGEELALSTRRRQGRRLEVNHGR